MERMHERRLLGQKWSGYLCPEAELVLSDNIQHGRCLAIKHSTEDIVEVESNKTCRVDLKNRTCSCRSWDITRIPCKHACATITWMGREIYQYCDWYMTVVAFRASYAPIIYPIPDYEKRFVPPEERVLKPPLTKKRRGRPCTRRINNRSLNTRPVKCSRCNMEGHNRASCNEPI